MQRILSTFRVAKSGWEPAVGSSAMQPTGRQKADRDRPTGPLLGNVLLYQTLVSGAKISYPLPVILEADADLSVCFDRLAIEGRRLVLPLFHSIQRRLREQGVAI
jgi:hypothetical protein